MLTLFRSRLDTRLSQLRAGGQGPYFMSEEHIGSSYIAKKPVNAKKVMCDGPTDQRTDGPTDRPTKQGVELCNTRLEL